MWIIFMSEKTIMATNILKLLAVRVFAGEYVIRQDNARSRTQALQCLYVRISNVDTQINISTFVKWRLWSISGSNET